MKSWCPGQSLSGRILRQEPRDGREVWRHRAKERRYIMRSGVALIKAKQRVQLQKQIHSIFPSSLSQTKTSPAPLYCPPEPTTQNNAVKLQLHLQPGKQRKPVLRYWQERQQHRSQALQLSLWLRRHPSVPTFGWRQPGNHAQHAAYNRRLTRRN